MNFDTRRILPAKLTPAWEPARAGLVSLALLTDNTQPSATSQSNPWLAQTAAQLSLQQRQRNAVIFACFGDVLVAAFDDSLSSTADFGAYLDAFAQLAPNVIRRLLPDAASQCIQTHLANDAGLQQELEPLLKSPQAVRDYCAAHLREMWELFLKAEWQRQSAQLRGLTSALKQPIAALNEASGISSERSAIELTRRLLQRDVPEWALAQLAGVSNVVVVLSPHTDLYVTHFGQTDTAYVFTQFDNALMRRTPVQRAEVLGPLNALADEARLRVLELLAASGELRGQELLGQLDVSQPNVSRHLKQLVAAGLVEERRAGDANKLYRFQPEGLRKLFHKLTQLLSEDNASANVSLSRAASARATALAAYPTALRPFLDDHGRVVYFSTKPREQRVVLDYMLSKFAPGRNYTEHEATGLIDQWLTPSPGSPGRFGIDAVTLRRALVEESTLRRTKDGASYWREATS